MILTLLVLEPHFDNHCPRTLLLIPDLTPDILCVFESKCVGFPGDLYTCPSLRSTALRGSFSLVQSLLCVRPFVIPWTAERQASLSIINSQSLLQLMSIESVIPSNCLILWHLLLFPLQFFPASRSFPKGQFLGSSGQSIGVSFFYFILGYR